MLLSGDKKAADGSGCCSQVLTRWRLMVQDASSGDKMAADGSGCFSLVTRWRLMVQDFSLR